MVLGIFQMYSGLVGLFISLNFFNLNDESFFELSVLGEDLLAEGYYPNGNNTIEINTANVVEISLIFPPI